MPFEEYFAGADFLAIGAGAIWPILLFSLAVVGIFIFLFFFGGYDRVKKKVPLFLRARDEIDLYEAEADTYEILDIIPKTYKVVIWQDTETKAYLMYIPALRSPVKPVPPAMLSQKVMKFVRIGWTFIPIKKIEFKTNIPKDAEIPTGTDEESIEKEKAFASGHEYYMKVVVPDIQSIVEDVQLELAVQAEIARPKQNSLQQTMILGVLGLLIFAIIITLWFSYGQAERAIGMGPAVVGEAMKGAVEVVRLGCANQTQVL